MEEEKMNLKVKKSKWSFDNFIGKKVELSVNQGSRNSPVGGIVLGLDAYGFMYIQIGPDMVCGYNVLHIASIVERPIEPVKEEVPNLPQQGQIKIDEQKNQKKMERDEMFRKKGIITV